MCSPQPAQAAKTMIQSYRHLNMVHIFFVFTTKSKISCLDLNCTLNSNVKKLYSDKSKQIYPSWNPVVSKSKQSKGYFGRALFPVILAQKSEIYRTYSITFKLRLQEIAIYSLPVILLYLESSKPQGIMKINRI